MTAPNKRLTAIILTVVFLLLIPVIAQFPWDLFDFTVAGTLLLTTGLLCELVMRKVKKTAYRALLITGILGMLIMIWGTMV